MSDEPSCSNDLDPQLPRCAWLLACSVSREDASPQSSASARRIPGRILSGNGVHRFRNHCSTSPEYAGDDEDIDLITVYLSLQGYFDNLRKQVFADLIIRNGGEFVGLEVSNKRGNLCCLFPDPQYPGHYRLSFHDQAGPVSHLVYSTAEQALMEAISLGYREHTPGQLDRLSEDPHWQFGLARVSETYSALRR
ncbi:hypothetical protein [Aeromonas sp. QDB66]|uniref:hypothetical protein n=1 Tax=Aeromonas sp. QDB66 TaxID=2989824 RepID=UPI0022E25966|nr:hypothetical protein [Aeromonas sp. QDB66]